jgi:hypothetical protein
MGQTMSVREAFTGAENIFFPLVLETSGHMHKDVDEFATLLGTYVEQHRRRLFHKRLIFTMSTALHGAVGASIIAHRKRMMLRNLPDNRLSGAY